MNDEVQASQTSFDHLDTVYSVISIPQPVKLPSLCWEQTYLLFKGVKQWGLKDLSHFQGLKPLSPWESMPSLLSFRSSFR